MRALLALFITVGVIGAAVLVIAGRLFVSSVSPEEVASSYVMALTEKDLDRYRTTIMRRVTEDANLPIEAYFANEQKCLNWTLATTRIVRSEFPDVARLIVEDATGKKIERDLGTSSNGNWHVVVDIDCS